MSDFDKTPRGTLLYHAKYHREQAVGSIQMGERDRARVLAAVNLYYDFLLAADSLVEPVKEEL